jgi:hypothetical protein
MLPLNIFKILNKKRNFMRKRRLTKKQVTYGIIGAIVVMTISVWLFAFFGPSPQTVAPASEVDVTNQESQNTPAEQEDERAIPTTDVEAEPTIDPANISRIEVKPLELSAAYVRGIPGFSFSVDRTASGTRYVEFQSESLIGSQCTDDKGAFASIIVNPSNQDGPALTITKVIDGTTYALSLPDDTCTSDVTLFKQYQSAFRDAFALLERLDADTV